MPFTLFRLEKRSGLSERVKSRRWIPLYSVVHYTFVQTCSSKTRSPKCSSDIRVVHTLSYSVCSRFFLFWTEVLVKPPYMKSAVSKWAYSSGHIESVPDAFSRIGFKVYKNWLICNNKTSCGTKHTLAFLRFLLLFNPCCLLTSLSNQKLKEMNQKMRKRIDQIFDRQVRKISRHISISK